MLYQLGLFDTEPSGESLFDADVRILVTHTQGEAAFKMSLKRASVTALLRAWCNMPETQKAKRNLVEKRMHERALSHEPSYFEYTMKGSSDGE